MGETSTLELIGRDDALAAITVSVEADRLPAALLLEGDAGIGKTSLWSAAVDAARERGYEVLSTRPVEAEAELAFAAVGDLLEPVLERILPRLPAPQARALRIALLLEESSRAPDARAIGLAFLGALRELAAETPVLVAIDDVQWLDRSSAAVVRFAARRLVREPVALLVSRRAGHDDLVTSALESVERVELGGLSQGALHRLLHGRLGLALRRPALRRVHELSRGNPFYALELGRAYLHEAIKLVPGDPLPPSLDALVGQRVAALPEETRDALAAAAALTRPTLALVGSADVLAAAVDAGIVDVDDGEIRFANPLLASAAYAALDDAARRTLHARLASVVEDVEERARHLALAAEAADEGVAAKLEHAAVVARARGAVAAAADLAERALALTPAGDPAAQRGRMLLTARLRFETGDAAGARTLLESVVAESPEGAPRAEALADLARIHMFEGTRRRAAALLRSALAAARDDVRVRATVEERLISTLIVLREDLSEAMAHARAAAERAERLRDEHVLGRALSALGFVGGVMGEPDAVATLERAVRLERYVGHLYGLERPSINLAAVLMWSDELDRARSIFASLYDEGAEEGDEGSLAWTAANLANNEFLAGRWDDALAWAECGAEIAGQTGQPAQRAYATATKALLHAHRGDVSSARDAAREALELSRDEVAIGWMNARWALGALELSVGNAAAAHEQLEVPSAHVEREQIGEPGTTRFVFDDVEALIALGRLDEAERRLAGVEANARRLDRTFALANGARCHGLLASATGDDGAALDAFRRALEHHERALSRFDHARTLLAYGTVLRRAQRKRDARDALDEATSSFERLGAARWAEQARAERRRIGGRTSSGGELTATERRVAELVAQGLSNRDVAAALFVTPKTVEFHLRNVFRKLGVRSRVELARRKD